VGDLPGVKEKINLKYLKQVVKANWGLKGFTYTRKHNLKENHKKIKWANENGFTINLSATNLNDVDRLAKLRIGPVTVVLPEEKDKEKKRQKKITPNGMPVIPCPEQTHGVKCINCQLCQIRDRKFAIGFYAHGIKKRLVSLTVV
jgi:hypothetical protein